jgi:hypothetical protein
MCTLDATTIIASFDNKELLMNTSPSRSRQLAAAMRDRGIKPEWEVFSPTNILQDVTTSSKRDSTRRALRSPVRPRSSTLLHRLTRSPPRILQN